MRLIVLGSGTSVPRPDRGSPGYLVQAAGRVIMLDLGPGSLRQLVRAGYGHDQVDAVFFSHFHPDHCADLIHFLFAAKYGPGYARTRPVRVIGPTGLKNLHQGLVQAFGPWMEPGPGTIEWIEVPAEDPRPIEVKDVTLWPGPVDHTPGALAWRIEAKGKALVYTGDTDWSTNLVELARGAEVLLAEAACPEGQKVQGHLMPSEAARIAAQAGVGRLILTHFYPECDPESAVVQAAGYFRGPVTAATDLMVIDL
ncbi:MAG: ribonuclease Z [Proteobacteria bacterium]|nr:ribonuclease Z [Pseudomonadota bacterium]MBU1742791.1 ribonuclease Z [Pseudomonadota bacterium]